MAVLGRRYNVGRLPGSTADLLRANPALGPALLAVATFLALGASNAGFYPTAWYPAGLLAVGALGTSLVALGVPRAVPRPVLVAIGLLAAYAAWSYLSITWASQPGPAWDGANRTAMLVVFYATFAIWPFDARGALAILTLLGLGIAGIGLVELLKANGAAEPLAYFVDVRFAEPAGYMNANVAMWTIGLLACLFVASRREPPAPLRGLSLGGAGLLAGLALMGQSRGWVLATPLALAFFLVICPGRVRLLAATGAVAVAGLAVRGPVLAAHDEYSRANFDGLLANAAEAILFAALALAVVGTAAALLDRRAAPGATASRRINAGVAALVALALVAGLALFTIEKGNPATEVADAWREFKTGGQGPQAGASRFAGGGTNRYDFWTVAWGAFRDHPVGGLGAENFQEEYLREGSSEEQPLYAHSLELGVLSQTGIVGAFLLFGGLGLALAAAFRARAAPLRERAAASAATAIFVYWLLHASVDWFWEFPGLTAPALACLGLAGALGPRAAAGSASAPRRGRRVVSLAAIGVLLAVAVSMAFPWLAARAVDHAARTWKADPNAALRQLDRAERLNPLSTRAQLTAATIALQSGRLDVAKGDFEQALKREPRNSYALLELGAIAAQDDRARGLRLLRRARALSPRDPDVARALNTLSQNRPLDLPSLNRSILRRARTHGSKVD
jgi:tetratricopeptide (TPR) repeat protein